MRRVVITGIGLVTPLGSGRKEFWPAVLAGRCAAGEINTFDTSAYGVHRGCEVRDFDFKRLAGNGKSPFPKRMGRASQLAIAATSLALQDGGLDVESPDVRRAGVSVGTTGGEIQILEAMDQTRITKGSGHVDPEWIHLHPSRTIPSNIAHWFGFQGTNLMIPTACAAGNYAIGYAYDLIRFHRQDLMVAGGTDPFSKVAFTGFARLGSIAPDVCRPFDKNRKGILVGEGAGIVVLESLESALARNATIYAEILGYGLSSDAHHMTAPDPEGRGITAAMSQALSQAAVSPQEVDYINFHGTGTPANDKVETKAVKGLFQKHSRELCVSSTKSMIGHTMGAASAIEAIVCTLAVRYDEIPPTIHYLTPDPECDLDCVPNVKRSRRVDVALNNAIAFGGNNSCLVVGKFDPSRTDSWHDVAAVTTSPSVPPENRLQPLSGEAL